MPVMPHSFPLNPPDPFSTSLLPIGSWRSAAWRLRRQGNFHLHSNYRAWGKVPGLGAGNSSIGADLLPSELFNLWATGPVIVHCPTLRKDEEYCSLLLLFSNGSHPIIFFPPLPQMIINPLLCVGPELGHPTAPLLPLGK